MTAPKITRARPAETAPWQAFESACELATGEALAALHREREARWRAITAGLGALDGIRALMAAGEVSQAHGAMMLRAAVGP